jgi:biopolymer transport protein TolR
MAMTSNNDSREVSSEINVTPLIDVLLVLLTIFMVIVPMVPKGQEALVPQPPNHHFDEQQPDRTIVVSVLHAVGNSLEYRINQDIVSKDALSARLTKIYANRAERVMFIKGDDDISYSQVAEVIDMGHSAGVDHVALLTPKVAAGL